MMLPQIGHTDKFDFNKLAERLLFIICSPESNSGIDTFNVLARGSMSEMSGRPFPVSLS